jgi:cell pole-organizing protein PopZ
MQKTEVYSWRLSPHLKARLEEAAREEQKSLAELLAEISEDWLRQSHRAQGAEEERQQRLREAALPFLGAIEGSRPDRAENARAELRSRIARRHGR